jgi:ferredoxin--NADP+ reductase
MPEAMPIPTQSRHVVAIVGGAVAGSEAAAVCAARGVTAIVIEQNDRPFGKIEDGLPRWHDKLRQKEYEQIGKNLTQDNVLFVPRTQLGRDLGLRELRDEWGVSAVLLASGAWRDRQLFDGADRYAAGGGLVYQNEFVYWYNHYPEPDYAGPRFAVHDDAIVVGGGLASIDVVKIVNLELFKRALAQRGVAVTSVELEHAGIPATLAAHGLSRAELGVKGVTLYYRREKTAMPLASAPEGASPQQLEKVGQVRAKLMDKVIEKYLVRFAPNRALEAPIVEDGKLVGLRFRHTKTVEGKLVMLEGQTDEVRSPSIISSIGSIPLPFTELPMKGELIDFEDWQSGKVRGFDNVFGLGNALTGKGNIKDSRKNSSEVSARLIEDYLLGEGMAVSAPLHQAAQDAAERAVAEVQRRPRLAPERIALIQRKVEAHWRRVGYSGDYAAWLTAAAREVHEQPGKA